MIIQRFSISIWFSLLFATSFSGAAHAAYGSSTAIAMFAIAFALSLVSLWFAYQNRFEKNALKTYADAFAIIGLILFLVSLFDNNLILALIEMLFFLQIALNLYFREHRQVYFGLVASFMALMCGAITSYSTWYIIYIVFFGIFACFYVAECHIDKQTNLALAQPNSPNQNLEQDTNYDQSWHWFSRFKVIIQLCLLSGFIYLITPRFPAGNLGGVQLKGWGTYQNETSAQSLLSESTDLSKHFRQMDSEGELAEENEFESASENADSQHGQSQQAPMPQNQQSPNSNQNQLFETNTDASSQTESTQLTQDNSVYLYLKSKRPRYLQIHTKTYFDGSAWHALQTRHKRLKVSPDKKSLQLYSNKPNASIDISVVKDMPTSIAATANTVAIRFPSKEVGKDYYDNLKTGDTLKKDTLYQLLLLDEFKQGRLIDTNQAPPDSKDLQLPKNLDARVALLAEEVVLGAKNDWQKAIKLEKHMRTNYQYSLKTLWNQNNIPVSDFLFDHKTGHCEYFATSLAMMLRSQGIPTRMQIGFISHDYNPVTGFYEVKGSNAHAWVSAYVDGAWVVLEGTAAYAPPDETNTDTSIEHNAHEELTEYLENLQKQNSLLEELKEQSMMESIQTKLTSFFYSMLVLLKELWHFLVKLLPFIILLSVMVFLGWKLIKHPKIHEHWKRKKTNKRVTKLLNSLQGYQPQEQKADTQLYIKVIQELTDILNIPRQAGMPISSYAQGLLEQGIINQQQKQWLCDRVNATFYANDISNEFMNLAPLEHKQYAVDITKNLVALVNQQLNNQ